MINRLHRIYSNKSNREGYIMATVYASPLLAIVLACVLDYIRSI